MATVTADSRQLAWAHMSGQRLLMESGLASMRAMAVARV